MQLGLLGDSWSPGAGLTWLGNVTWTEEENRHVRPFLAAPTSAVPLPLILMLPGRILRRFPHVRLRAPLPATTALPQSRGFATPSANDLFANGTNTYYVEEMYRHWKGDPKSVHASWDVYFSGLEKGLPSSEAFQRPPSVMPAPSDGAPALHANSGAELDDHLKVSPTPFCACSGALTSPS